MNENIKTKTHVCVNFHFLVEISVATALTAANTCLTIASIQFQWNRHSPARLHAFFRPESRNDIFSTHRAQVYLSSCEWVTVETFKIDSLANWRCVCALKRLDLFPSSVRKTRCKPLSHTCILLILQVCFLPLSLARCEFVLMPHVKSHFMRLLSFKWTKLEKWTRVPIQFNSNTAPRLNQAFQAEMNLVWIYFYSVVLWFRYRISKLTSLLHTRTQIETN